LIITIKLRSILLIHQFVEKSGESGIRTHGTLLTYTRFPSPCSYKRFVVSNSLFFTTCSSWKWRKRTIL